MSRLTSAATTNKKYERTIEKHLEQIVAESSTHLGDDPDCGHHAYIHYRHFQARRHIYTDFEFLWAAAVQRHSVNVYALPVIFHLLAL